MTEIKKITPEPKVAVSLPGIFSKYFVCNYHEYKGILSNISLPGVDFLIDNSTKLVFLELY